jgi:hypothetical protein
VAKSTGEKMSWEKLHGKYTLMAVSVNPNHPFDTNACGFAFQIDNKKYGPRTVFVFENPDDGYRSYAIAPMIVNANMYEFGNSPVYIRVDVIIKDWSSYSYDDYYFTGSREGIVVLDAGNKKPVLFLGTQNTDDYYPSYTAQWHPENLSVNE